LASLYFEYYDDIELLKTRLDEQEKEIQCVVSKLNLNHSVPLGKSQRPEWNDYADRIDTLAFLLAL
jgi:hypothetical protein